MIDLSKYTKELSKLFSTSENILLICHINPDGDAIGSQLALYHYLKIQGKKCQHDGSKLSSGVSKMDGWSRSDKYLY